MSQDWDIKPCAGVCSACGTSFQDRQSHLSCLAVSESGYQRRDYCEACWTKPESRSHETHSVWRGIFKAPPPEAPEPLEKETAESLLRKFMETEDPSKRNAIYVLAVMLERKRILVERDGQVRDDGTKIIVYEHRKTGDVFLVPDPGLRLDQLAAVQSEIATLLGFGKELAPASPEPAEAAGDGAVSEAEAESHTGAQDVAQ